MAATLYKIIKTCTGEVATWDGTKMIKRMRELGVVIKHEVGGNEWLELRLWSDILNPVLFQQVKGNAMKPGESMFTAVLCDVPRKLRDPTVNPEEEMPAGEGAENEG